MLDFLYCVFMFDQKIITCVINLVCRLYMYLEQRFLLTNCQTAKEWTLFPAVVTPLIWTGQAPRLRLCWVSEESTPRKEIDRKLWYPKLAKKHFNDFLVYNLIFILWNMLSATCDFAFHSVLISFHLTTREEK